VQALCKSTFANLKYVVAKEELPKVTKLQSLAVLSWMADIPFMRWKEIDQTRRKRWLDCQQSKGTRGEDSISSRTAAVWTLKRK
jgi:hypothetical protein